jgi:hypothetical protein
MSQLPHVLIYAEALHGVVPAFLLQPQPAFGAAASTPAFGAAPQTQGGMFGSTGFGVSFVLPAAFISGASAAAGS